jgi:hypothetical protein
MKSRNAAQYPAALFVAVGFVGGMFIGALIGLYWQGSEDRRAEEGLRDKTLDMYVDSVQISIFAHLPLAA